LIAALVTVLRWVAFGFEPGVGPLIFLQALHAITFALSLIAVVGFIANHTDEGIAAQAQSFYVMLQQGASILALMVFGSLVGSWGAEAYFLSAGIAALGAACILASLVLKPPREKSD
jgi:PPP family 3-phenylpropionic acid transporter